jgi:hypothetical protein
MLESISESPLGVPWVVRVLSVNLYQNRPTQTTINFRKCSFFYSGSLPKVKRTAFASTIPSASVAISQADEPRLTNGRTVKRSTSTPHMAQRSNVRPMLDAMFHFVVTCTATQRREQATNGTGMPLLRTGRRRSRRHRNDECQRWRPALRWPDSYQDEVMAMSGRFVSDLERTEKLYHSPVWLSSFHPLIPRGAPFKRQESISYEDSASRGGQWAVRSQ